MAKKKKNKGKGSEEEKEKQEKNNRGEEEKKITKEELAKKYDIDLNKLEDEQKKLAENIHIDDSMEFNVIERVAGVENIFFKNKIISAIVVMNSNFEVLEQQYFSDKVRFPYISGFRAYRELPSMIQCFNLLEEKPSVVFIKGHGIAHPNGLGLASHFSISTGVPAIGIADSLLVGEIRKEDIVLNKKVIGKVLKTKEGGKPLLISPGNLISLKSAVELTKKFTKEPHKFPEPLTAAHKYAREIRKELFKI